MEFSLFQVALVYPNSDPLSFMCAFYGCITAGVVPVPIEVPLTRRVCIKKIMTFIILCVREQINTNVLVHLLINF